MEILFKQIGEEVREYTPEEYEQHKVDVEEFIKLSTEQERIKAEEYAARQALLDKLGITEDEAKLLLGGN